MERTQKFAAGFVLGLLAGVAGSAIAYKKRRHIKKVWWRWQAKADIHRRIAALKRLTRASYDEIVDDVINRYEAAGMVMAEEAQSFAAELKRKYGSVKERIEETVKEADDEE